MGGEELGRSDSAGGKESFSKEGFKLFFLLRSFYETFS